MEVSNKKNISRIVQQTSFWKTKVDKKRITKRVFFRLLNVGKGVFVGIYHNVIFYISFCRDVKVKIYKKNCMKGES